MLDGLIQSWSVDGSIYGLVSQSIQEEFNGGLRTTPLCWIILSENVGYAHGSMLSQWIESDLRIARHSSMQIGWVRFAG